MGVAITQTYLGASGRWVPGDFGDMAVKTWFLKSPIWL
jgi:hypothetical protein